MVRSQTQAEMLKLTHEVERLSVEIYRRRRALKSMPTATNGVEKQPGPEGGRACASAGACQRRRKGPLMENMEQLMEELSRFEQLENQNKQTASQPPLVSKEQCAIRTGS